MYSAQAERSDVVPVSWWDVLSVPGVCASREADAMHNPLLIKLKFASHLPAWVSVEIAVLAQITVLCLW